MKGGAGFVTDILAAHMCSESTTSGDGGTPWSSIAGLEPAWYMKTVFVVSQVDVSLRESERCVPVFKCQGSASTLGESRTGFAEAGGPNRGTCVMRLHLEPLEPL